METSVIKTFIDATVAQVRTVFVETKTAAIVIFACGFLAGCVLT